MAMARMKRTFSPLNLSGYQRSDTLNKFLSSPPGMEEGGQEENSLQAVIQQQMQRMLEDKFTSDANKADLADAPWTGPSDPLGDY